MGGGKNACMSDIASGDAKKGEEKQSQGQSHVSHWAPQFFLKPL